MSVLFSNVLRIKVKIEYKSNQFYWYKVQSQDCHQSHVYSYTRTIKDLIILNISTNIVIGETKIYEKYGINACV